MIWQLLNVFVDIVTPVFILVFLGYFVGPRLQLEARTLSRIAYYLFLPAFIFNIISKAEIQASLAGEMVLYTVLTHLLSAICGFLLAKFLRRSPEMTAAYVMIAIFGNVGNFGLSLIDFRLGPQAEIPATIYFVSILVISFVICVGVASWTHHGGLSAVLSVFKTPALLALGPALLFYGTDLEVPLFLSRLTGLLGKAMVPVMLVTLGVQLSEVSHIKIKPDMLLASSVRLLVTPLIAIELSHFFNLSGIELRAGILQAGMPVAVLVSIIAIEHKIMPEFVTTTVLFSTVLSILTLTILLTFV
ncbi:MAG: AEC family transporter [SAR324 cluster bacterium]|nr:AEC family transporter [SAR324 cluster bacterium]